MVKKRTIAVFSGNRAEYGLQFPILKAIDNHPRLDYRLIVSGAHLDDNFGATIDEIKNDGFEIYAEVKIDMSGGKRVSTAKAIASGIMNLLPVLEELKPDIFLVYADRFEGFAAVITSTQMNIPTAHVEGGDITEGGALDDSVRHAMTKLAHLHYTTNEQATNRILAMGEESWRVETVGFPAIDMIKNGFYESPENIVELFGLDPRRPVVIFTQHSVTTEFENAFAQIRPSLEALKKIADEGVQVIMTYPNNDVGGEDICGSLHSLMDLRNPNIQLQKSVGRFRYHGILALSRVPGWKVVCVGNSSSGIKETSVFGCPTVNIGSRQKGRLRGENIIDVDYSYNDIYRAIKKCIDNEEFRAICASAVNPYGGGNAGELIAESLANIDLESKKLLRKRMTISGFEENGWFQ